MLKRIWFALSAIAFFFAYGGGRTMYESPAFTLAGFWTGFFFVGLFFLLLICIYNLFFVLSVRQSPPVKIVICYGIAALIGLVVSEITVTADELAFKREATAFAKAREFDEVYYRSRAWPNETGQLYWSGVRGYWATD